MSAMKWLRWNGCDEMSLYPFWRFPQYRCKSRWFCKSADFFGSHLVSNVSGVEVVVSNWFVVLLTYLIGIVSDSVVAPSINSLVQAKPLLFDLAKCLRCGRVSGSFLNNFLNLVTMFQVDQVYLLTSLTRWLFFEVVGFTISTSQKEG